MVFIVNLHLPGSLNVIHLISNRIEFSYYWLELRLRVGGLLRFSILFYIQNNIR
jgi:hypothetical protein